MNVVLVIRIALDSDITYNVFWLWKYSLKRYAYNNLKVLTI